MRKNYFKWPVLLLAAVFSFSCSDDSDLDERRELNSALEHQTVIIVNPDRWITFRTKRDLDFNFDRSINRDSDIDLENIKYEIGNLEGNTAVKFSLKDRSELLAPIMANVIVKFRDGNSQQQKFTLVMQPSSASFSPVREDDTYLQSIGQSIDYTGRLISPDLRDQILDFDLLYNTNRIKINLSTGAEGTVWESKRTQYESVKEEMTYAVGVDVKVGLGKSITDTGSSYKTSYKSNFSAMVDVNGEKAWSEKHEHEYTITMIRKNMGSARLASTLMANPSANVDSLIKYLTPEANYFLQNVAIYPNTEKGIHDMYKRHGTHVIVGGVYGGMHFYIYGRQKRAYQENIYFAASASASLTQTFPISPEMNFMATYLAYLGAKGAKLSGSGSTSSEVQNEDQLEQSFTKMLGGDASFDINVWDRSITATDTKKWALIGYDNNTDRLEEFETEQGILPLYYFVKDQTRRDAMRKYLETYIQKYSTKFEQKKSRMVLADVMMIAIDPKDKNVKTEKFKILKSPDGKTRTYYPILENRYGVSQSNLGHKLNTSNEDYYAPNADYQHTWWYALDYEDACKGIADIKLGTTDNPPTKDGVKYTKRGNSSQYGTKITVDEHYLYVLYAGDDVKFEDKLKSVAIIRGKEKDAKSLSKYAVCGSSGGTEETFPSTSTSDKVFKEYWTYNTSKPNWFISNTMEQKHSFYGTYTGGHHDYWIFIAFSKKTLPEEFAIQKDI